MQMIFRAIKLNEITKGGSMDREKGQELSLQALKHLAVRYSNEDQEEAAYITGKGGDVFSWTLGWQTKAYLMASPGYYLFYMAVK